MRKDKMHFMPPSLFKKASAFHKKNGFWNPMMTPAGNPCGIEPHQLTSNWRKVTCKLCKRARTREDRPNG
jgi:hypothetical protein